MALSIGLCLRLVQALQSFKENDAPCSPNNKAHIISIVTGLIRFCDPG